jgi:hypothetical protein
MSIIYKKWNDIIPTRDCYSGICRMSNIKTSNDFFIVSYNDFNKYFGVTEVNSIPYYFFKSKSSFMFNKARVDRNFKHFRSLMGDGKRICSKDIKIHIHLSKLAPLIFSIMDSALLISPCDLPRNKNIESYNISEELTKKMVVLEL